MKPLPQTFYQRPTLDVARDLLGCELTVARGRTIQIGRLVEVEAYIDKLLGRKQALDPDFFEMRRDKGFRELIAKMCEGTNDPNCVYGAQKDGRER